MKKKVIFAISLLLVVAVNMKPACVQAASMAVLVVGLETDAASDVFAAGIKYEFTQKNYTLIDNDAVKTKLADLRQAYKEGQTIDTIGLAAWGKENNIDFVQLVVEKGCDITIDGVTKSGREQLAQVVRCGTTKYTERGYYRTQFVRHLDPNPNLGTEFEEMVFVAGGVFEMGCKDTRDNVDGWSCNSNEQPPHYVRVNSFYIGKYEVTQALWKAVMGSLPSGITGNYLGDNKPVNFLSSNDIVDSSRGFLEKLNAQTGKNYRLPTEAEWEYAARGCSGGNCEPYQYSGSNAVEDVAWYGRSGDSLRKVGQKLPNALGLYDMSGNVREWCSDWYDVNYYSSTYTVDNPQYNPRGAASGSYRVLRGGNWVDNSNNCRVAYRNVLPSGSVHRPYGFRLV
jgi:formylglycine-generating enzyme required for sulfatase activity